MQTSPEFALVIACCRRSAGRDAAVRACASVAIDWDLVLAVARRHRVEGLVHDALRPVELPPAIRAAFAHAATGIARANLAFAAAALRLHDGFGDIPHLFVKGVTLDMLAYGTLALKRASDIDVVADAAGYARASAVLEGQGYACIFPGPGRSAQEIAAWTLRRKHTTWTRADVMIELHAHLVDNPHLLPTLSARSPAQMVAMAPGRGLPTLERDALFAYLCVHGAAHAWSRLKWLADLDAFMGHADEHELARLHHAAVALGAGRCSAQGLLLCARLFGRDLGPALLAELRRDPATRLLVRTARASMTRGGPAAELDAQPLGTVLIHLSHFWLARGWRYKAAEASRKLFATGDAQDARRPLRTIVRWLGSRLRNG